MNQYYLNNQLFCSLNNRNNINNNYNKKILFYRWACIRLLYKIEIRKSRRINRQKNKKWMDSIWLAQVCIYFVLTNFRKYKKQKSLTPVSYQYLAIELTFAQKNNF